MKQERITECSAWSDPRLRAFDRRNIPKRLWASQNDEQPVRDAALVARRGVKIAYASRGRPHS